MRIPFSISDILYLRLYILDTFLNPRKFDKMILKKTMIIVIDNSCKCMNVDETGYFVCVFGSHYNLISVLIKEL